VTDAERQAALEAIATEVAACTRCRLHSGRTHAVPGEGSPDTEVVFVGEGPGEQEDRQGRPFVGASGGLLTELIESLGWRRRDVFITNVVKCRPPGNRDPEPDEIAACSGFLRRQLEVLDPAVVVTVGKHSLNAFRPGERIGRVHGTSVPADPASGAGSALVFSMYHPAFALYQGSNRETLFNDIAGLPATLVASRDRRATGAPSGPDAAVLVAVGAAVGAALGGTAGVAAVTETTGVAAVSETTDVTEVMGLAPGGGDTPEAAHAPNDGDTPEAADAPNEGDTPDSGANEIDPVAPAGAPTEAIPPAWTDGAGELLDPGQMTLF
jgi:DNA polymerase